MINIYEKAPLDIMVVDASGAPVSLRSLLGSYVVLYAYPQDETPGCIEEACSVRDVYDEFKSLGVAVVGISPDDADSHVEFAKNHELKFPLWADTKHQLLEALGVWGEQSFAENTFMGVARTTFLLDPDGIVVHVWEKVTPEGHGEEVLEFVTKYIEDTRE